ncbi:Alcohol oxidase [Grifola frondosa]|uniref:Alcohol oxidase n=1 Tax=Grifola frondosa TaxID=5627 RepID=A0A1C7LQL0_GRIFR|nr:Alcohol oxidase [Grifola frondosa]
MKRVWTRERKFSMRSNRMVKTIAPTSGLYSRPAKTDIEKLNFEFDIIFAGGGTTAGVIAGRLAAADPSLKILILETGPGTQDDLAHTQPGRFLTHLRPDSTTVRFIDGNPSEHLNGRSLNVQCGQCVGGGSSVNFMMYTRASASDYNDWEKVHDNPGWGFEDLLPLSKKAETYQIAADRPTHGYSGPLKRTLVDDANTMTEVNGYVRWPKWIDERSGKRSDVPHHFIYNQQASNKNLQLLAGCSVRRIVFEHNRAVGVEYLHNTRVRPGADDVPHIARSKRLVVVSAGACGSPAILERSGIGAKDILEKHGIQSLVDLPGVGENYQDHTVLFVPFLTSNDSDSLDGIAGNDQDEITKWTPLWLEEGKGLLATNGIDGGVKFRPTPEELKIIGPEFEKRWTSFYSNKPDKAISWYGCLAAFVGTVYPEAGQKAYSMAAYLTYPAGVGSMHITSAEDVNAPPDFDTGVFSCPEDVAVMKYLYKRCRELGRRMACYRGDYAAGHPAFPEGSAAAPQKRDRPFDIDEPDIAYSPEDEQAIEEYLKATVATAWHSIGTCAMKPRNKGGVVDARLNVYGVEGLKVADLSICPGNVGTNTSLQL